MNRGKVPILFFSVLVIISSCKITRKIAVNENWSNISVNDFELRIYKELAEIKTLKYKRIKLNIIKNEKSNKLTGTIGIVKDSIIVISLIPMMGYEAARIYCTKDTIYILNRPEKTYYKENLIKEMKLHNIQFDYHDLQDLLINQSFVYVSDEEINNIKISKKLYESNEFVELEISTYKNEKLAVQQIISGEPKKSVMKAMKLKEFNSGVTAKITYDDFIMLGNIWFPTYMKIQIENENLMVDIDLKIGEISLNEKINAELLIPSEYERTIQ